MVRKQIGSKRPMANGVAARIHIADGVRRTFPLGVSEEAADERIAVLVEIADRLRGVVSPDDATKLLRRAASATTPAALDGAKLAADLLASGTTKKLRSALAPTFEEFAAKWTSKELHRLYPDHVREKDEAEDVQQLRDYINPIVGHVRLPDFELEHAELVMRGLPERLGPKTRKHVAQCMRKVMALAVYPGRHVKVNPIPKEWMPKVPKSAKRAKACLYPSEDAMLVSCAAIPLERRIAYGILTREGMRVSEALGLAWADVDLERGAVTLDENKTDDPRSWALRPDVVRALTKWKAAHPKSTGPFADLTEHHIAKRLRDHLQAAHVSREELYRATGSRIRLRVHDLRATFVTVNLAQGKTESWVQDRTGHKTTGMIAKYRRAARKVEELGLGDLGALDVLLFGEGGHGVGSDRGPNGASEKKMKARKNKLVAPAGVEPARPCGPRILKPNVEFQASPDRPGTRKTRATRDGANQPDPTLDPTLSALARGVVEVDILWDGYDALLLSALREQGEIS